MTESIGSPSIDGDGHHNTISGASSVAQQALVLAVGAELVARELRDESA